MVEWPALMASTLASGSLAAVHVDADHGKTRLGKGHGQGQAHIAQADACTEPCAVLSLSKGRSDGYMCSMVFDFGEKLFFHYNHGFLGFCNHEWYDFATTNFPNFTKVIGARLDTTALGLKAESTRLWISLLSSGCCG